jgi:hypothetical protein
MRATPECFPRGTSGRAPQATAEERSGYTELYAVAGRSPRAGMDARERSLPCSSRFKTARSALSDSDLLRIRFRRVSTRITIPSDFWFHTGFQTARSALFDSDSESIVLEGRLETTRDPFHFLPSGGAAKDLRIADPRSEEEQSGLSFREPGMDARRLPRPAIAYNVSV